jgi:hypothetical protein
MTKGLVSDSFEITRVVRGSPNIPPSLPLIEKDPEFWNVLWLKWFITV